MANPGNLRSMALLFRLVDRFLLRLGRAAYKIRRILYNEIIDLASSWPRRNRRSDRSGMSRRTGTPVIMRRRAASRVIDESPPISANLWIKQLGLQSCAHQST
jgi:hypothetical protein